jgi:hypothetical protein
MRMNLQTAQMPRRLVHQSGFDAPLAPRSLPVRNSRYFTISA